MANRGIKMKYSPVKSRLTRGAYGERVRVIDQWKNYKRLYVKRTNIKTYVVLTENSLTLDNMCAVNGEYHFDTLKHLHGALQADCNY